MIQVTMSENEYKEFQLWQESNLNVKLIGYFRHSTTILSDYYVAFKKNKVIDLLCELSYKKDEEIDRLASELCRLHTEIDSLRPKKIVFKPSNLFIKEKRN